MEGTSGSTGISLAAVARARGYRCIIVMPDDQADEKVAMLRTLGARVIQVRQPILTLVAPAEHAMSCNLGPDAHMAAAWGRLDAVLH